MIRAALLGAALLAVLPGCASVRPPMVAGSDSPPGNIELTATPFFPQDEFQCGPAALATVLNSTGAAVAPAALVPQVFVPGRRGSLQAELVGAARRHGRLAYALEAEPAVLLAELAAGHPVLVLQNLGLRRWPRWHYAVLVGYDAESQRAILRSGREQRLIMKWSRFISSLERADKWGLVVLRPGQMPATVQPLPYLAAVAGLESADQREAARISYDAALERWPEQPLAWLGRGNVAHADGDIDAALDAYARAVRFAPEAVAPRLNLAATLLEAGCAAAAERAAGEAAVLAGDSPLAPTIEQLRHHAQAAAVDGTASARCAGLALPR